MNAHTMSKADDMGGAVFEDSKTPGAPGTVVVEEDPAAPSKDVSSKRQSLSDLFTIVWDSLPVIDGFSFFPSEA